MEQSGWSNCTSVVAKQLQVEPGQAQTIKQHGSILGLKSKDPWTDNASAGEAPSGKLSRK